MEFTTKRNEGGNYDIFVGEIKVGVITKSIHTEYKDIKGTMLRETKGRDVTKYFVRLFGSKFSNGFPGILSPGGYGARSLKSAKQDVAERLARLILKEGE